MQKIECEGIALEPISGFAVIGDPGCDGLGVEIMSVFNAACHEAAGDFILIVGDIVPDGTSRYYRNVVEMLDSAVDNPIYMLAGNHDTLDYETHFGKKDYFLYDSRLLLVVLDNSKRVFSQETLNLLKRALEYKRDNIILAFHIPPPNKVTRNSVSEEEWVKVRDIIAPVLGNVKYLICGHVHSYFEDDIGGIKLVASGGGGARIEDVTGVEAPSHHLVEFSFDPAGNLRHIFKPITYTMSSNTPTEVLDALKKAYTGECMAFVRYRLYAEEALRNNKPHLAKLFAAAADSEFYHARNFFYAMNGFKPLEEAISESIKNEYDEVNNIYLSGENISKHHSAGLAAYAFSDARAAERVHLRLFNEAKELLKQPGNCDISKIQYFTCTSCGYTLTDGQNKSACPLCGAPPDKIYAV